MSKALTTYTAVETVQAFRISSIARIQGGVNLYSADKSVAPVFLSDNWYMQHWPSSRGYYFRHEDGSADYMEAEAFEKKFSRKGNQQSWASK